MLKSVLLIFSLTVIKQVIGHSDVFQCKPEILKYYGFEGLQNPVAYAHVEQDLETNFCPNIEHSCCSREDYEKAAELWEVKSVQIKRYLSTLMRVIEKATVVQSVMRDLINQVSGKQNEYCKEVNLELFSSQIKYEEVYFYIKNAFETFSYMQKGFYCSVCDAKDHQYMGIDDGINVPQVIISNEFCSKIVYFFKKFVAYKLYFIDPLLINSNFLFNCYKGVNTYEFNFHYSHEITAFRRCIEENEDCEILCKEFSIGKASDLLIGDLTQYVAYFKSMEEIVEMTYPEVYTRIHGEAEIETEDISSEFFFDEESTKDLPDKEEVFKHSLSDWEIDVRTDGINLFESAKNAAFFYTSAESMSARKDNVQITVNADGTTSEQEFEREHEKEKMDQDPLQPTRSELPKLNTERDKMEQVFAEKSRQGVIDNIDFGNEASDFEEIAKVPQGNSAMRLGAIFTLTLLLNLIK